ncbi:helix-turn-helix domain-containing protein [Collinsella sp. zg1085]|uniref:helix-turn-helix domain-containing protein n=1 Tax=Collinsella sp. zg1085 TaxID=2844380 RepID=UPI001C0D0E55|nr:helix-turn-helix transcriptional regulator [Collinsella sp. zg1085]QWT17796.1 helix-turn-helix domain-containing protein [Collinsella sp. zg1085]
MNFGKAVRRRAAELGLSQTQLCLMTGISNAYMSMLMNSKIDDPRIGRVAVIAHALKLSLDELVERAKIEDEKVILRKNSRGGGDFADK